MIQKSKNIQILQFWCVKVMLNPFANKSDFYVSYMFKVCHMFKRWHKTREGISTKILNHNVYDILQNYQ